VFDLYVGAAAAVCALAGIAARRRGAVAIAAGVAGSCLIALGDRTPLLRWLYDDGFFRSIRYPEKFILSAMFLVVIFGAITFDRMVAGDRRAIRLACGFATILGGVAAVAYVLSWTPSYARWFARTWSIGNPGAAESMIAISRAGWLHAGIRWAILLTLLLWLLRSIPAAAHGSEPTDQWLPSRLWYAAGALFLLFDLAFAPGRILERMPPEFFRKPPAASGLDDRYRLFHEAAILETVFREGPAVSGNRRQWIARNGLYPRSSAAWGIPMVYDGDYDLTNLEPTRKLFAALVEARQGATHFPEVFLSISNVGYVARHRRDPGGRISLQHPVEFERRRYPRYYLADQIVQIRDLREFLDMASRGSWSDRVAFVEFPPFPSAGGRVDVIEESANSVRLRVQSDGRGYLVIGITPHEYWRASVDGREVKLLPANVAYQGLVIPPGTHTIDMRYRNPLFFFGGGISGLALAGLIAVVAWPGRCSPAQRSRSSRPDSSTPAPLCTRFCDATHVTGRHRDLCYGPWRSEDTSRPEDAEHHQPHELTSRTA
jgi:hypothetical protein